MIEEWNSRTLPKIGRQEGAPWADRNGANQSAVRPEARMKDRALMRRLQGSTAQTCLCYGGMLLDDQLVSNVDDGQEAGVLTRQRRLVRNVVIARNAVTLF
jgi:hypothetical protein